MVLASFLRWKIKINFMCLLFKGNCILFSNGVFKLQKTAQHPVRLIIFSHISSVSFLIYRKWSAINDLYDLFSFKKILKNELEFRLTNITSSTMDVWK